MFCPACGKEIPENSNYCMFCGSSVSEPAPTEASLNENTPAAIGLTVHKKGNAQTREDGLTGFPLHIQFWLNDEYGDATVSSGEVTIVVLDSGENPGFWSYEIGNDIKKMQKAIDKAKYIQRLSINVDDFEDYEFYYNTPPIFFDASAGVIVHLWFKPIEAHSLYAMKSSSIGGWGSEGYYL
jgi:hypothetical protein